MMRSMYSGVSGLRAHQAKMDTIGNNIANVNTVGFKGQRVTFQEVFNQTIKGAGSPKQGGRGGTNPQQVGLGISISSIDTFHIRGAVQRTDNNTDLAINGDGFFMVTTNGNDRYYTRAGNFILDEEGNLVTSNGMRVYGLMEDTKSSTPAGTMDPTLTTIKIPKSISDGAAATTETKLEGNLDSRMKLNPPNTDSKYVTNSSFYDSLGNKHNYTLTFTKTAEDDTGSTWNLQVADDAATPNLSNITLNFDTSGKLTTTGVTPVDGAIAVTGRPFAFQIDPGYQPSGANVLNPIIDLSNVAQFANSSDAVITTKDGYTSGSLDTFSISPSGQVYAVFTNGSSRAVAQLKIARFNNPAGLEKVSENNYMETANSGEAIIGYPGDSGLGTLNPGTLEMSNVDISTEFTEMISTQRGFQANSRIITTSDEMLQELVNMKR